MPKYVDSAAAAYLWNKMREISPSEGGGTTDYNDLTNKPSIEGVTLQGNKTFPELKLDVLTNIEIENLLS